MEQWVILASGIGDLAPTALVTHWAPDDGFIRFPVVDVVTESSETRTHRLAAVPGLRGLEDVGEF